MRELGTQHELWGIGRHGSGLASKAVLISSITLLRSKGYRYENIICSFCRGIWGSHDAAANRFWNAIVHE